MRFFLKIVISALIIAGVSEVAKRNKPMAAILASLPLTSMMAMIWLYHDTGNARSVGDLSVGIFWAVLPSLLFFITLPMFLKSGLRFAFAMSASSVITFFGYLVYGWALGKFGIKI